MSRIAPDIPELERVPEAARSLVYMNAFNRAVRSPLTWLTGGVVFAAAVGVGATEGRALFGAIGAALGVLAGASAATWCFLKVILPWRARSVVPSVIDHSGGNIFDDVSAADANVKRMIEAYKRREAGGTDEMKGRRPPDRFP